MATDKPIIFLAFANEQDDRVRYLRNLPEEARRLHEILDAAEQDELCEARLTLPASRMTHSLH